LVAGAHATGTDRRLLQNVFACSEIAMNQPVVFSDILDAAEQLDADAQSELVAVLTRRLAERGRERVAATAAQARREFATGQCQPMTAGELMREALS
jgi:hypothetical protein